MVKLNVMKSFLASFLPSLSGIGEHPTSVTSINNLVFDVILKRSFAKSKDN
jgi:hypothetical protein